MKTYRVVIRKDDGSDEHVVATGKGKRIAERIAYGVKLNLSHVWTVATEQEQESDDV